MSRLWPAILALAVLLASAISCSPDGPSGPITSFTADKAKVTKGTPDKLTAVFTGGTASIDNDIGEVQSGVPVDTAMLTKNTTFTLTVNDENGKAFAKTLEVGAVDPATIASFKSEKVIRPGEATNLTAVFAGGTGKVDGGIGAVTSGTPVSTGILPATKVFTLTVTNEAGDTVTAKAEAEAAVTPVIMSFTAPGQVVSRFAPTMLTAVFTGGSGGKGTIDQGVGSITSNMPAKTKDVPAAGTTFTLTVTNGLGESVQKSVTVTTKKELFVVDYGADVLVFDVDAVGDVEPKRILVTDATIQGILGVVVTNDELFLANENGTPSISVFNISDGSRPPYGAGDPPSKPKRKLSGAATTFDVAGGGTVGPYLFSVGGGEIFVADKSSTVKIWNVADTGNVAPRRTLGGAASGVSNALGTWVTGGELFVSNYANAGAQSSITVYPQTATDNTAPLRTISTPTPTGVVVEGNEVFVSNKDGAITVYNKTTGAPLRKIAGAATQLTELYQCSVADGELFCGSYLADKVLVFPANADGNVAPTRVIKGDKTFVSSPGCVVVF